jgi:REP element-mobilizing transposase RayT
MFLNDAGMIVLDCWRDLSNHYANIILDAFFIMPDHVHGIIEIADAGIVDTGFKPVSTMPALHGLSEFIRALKTFSARKINQMRQTPGVPVWQSRFYDRIIRNADELHRIRKYIIDNPRNG